MSDAVIMVHLPNNVPNSLSNIFGTLFREESQMDARHLAIPICRRQPLHEKRDSSQNEIKLNVGNDGGRTIARMVGGGQWGKRIVGIETLPDGNPTDVVAVNVNVGIQRQGVICRVSMIVETKDYLAIASV